MHFTYDKDPDRRGLKQGDVIRLTPEIEQLLRQIHPCYLRSDYRYFLVLTQTCDLIQRKEACKARYISLAAVRPFDLVLQREIERRSVAPSSLPNVCRADTRLTVKQFLERLLNNNDHDYFYLHQQPDCELGEPACAFLRLSIAVKSSGYGTILAAKILQLTEAFQHKLGWLVGDVYSRVGTEDWRPDDLEQRIKRLLDERCVWAKRSFLDPLVDWAGRQPGKPSLKEVFKAYQALVKETPTKYTRLAGVLREELQKLEVDDEVVSKLLRRLPNHPEIRPILAEGKDGL